MIFELIEQHPYFRALYEDLYNMCLNVEGVMNMWSEELAILDRNTEKLMIEEYAQEVDALKAESAEMKAANAEIKAENAEMKASIADKDATIADRDATIADKDAEIAKLRQKLSEYEGSGN